MHFVDYVEKCLRNVENCPIFVPTKTNNMRRTETFSETLRETVLTSKDTLNRGTVFFRVALETNTYEDGSVKKQVVCTKQDGREYTDIGRSFQIYRTEKGMNSAINRLVNSGEFDYEFRKYTVI